MQYINESEDVSEIIDFVRSEVDAASKSWKTSVDAIPNDGRRIPVPLLFYQQIRIQYCTG